jgi:pyruvate dehydrogenase E1 component alpha subunit
MGMTRELRLAIYDKMYLAQRWEAGLFRLIEQGLVSGIYHSGRGHEGVEVGAVMALRDDDYLFYDHRGCAHIIAKGIDLPALYGDFLGNCRGSTHGLGAGIVHVCDPSRGIMGQSGTLGRGQILAAGAALSAYLRDTDQVSMHFFGDGAANVGTFHEAANVAGAWKLPLIFVVQNNGWAVSVPVAHSTGGGGFARRADAYGMAGIVVDGSDAFAVYDATMEAVARARRGDGPTIIEAKVTRMRGHFEGDAEKYRQSKATRDDAATDPVLIARSRLLSERLASENELQTLEEKIHQRLDAALREAKQADMPTRERIFNGVYV